MKTKPRSHIKSHSLREIVMPYELSINYYGPTTRYKDNNGKELETPIVEHKQHVHIMIYDDAIRYAGRDGKGLSQKMHGGICTITNNDIDLETAIKIAKMDALDDLAQHCNAGETIYACFAKNLNRFLNDGIIATGTEREETAVGKVTIIEARTM
jgi:hypothetical protein